MRPGELRAHKAYKAQRLHRAAARQRQPLPKAGEGNRRCFGASWPRLCFEEPQRAARSACLSGTTAGGPGMGDRVAALRRKLDALAYAEPLEAGSAALAERLLADLVATTESWRALKLRDAARGQQLAAFQAQARACALFYLLHQVLGPAGGPHSTAESWRALKLCAERARASALPPFHALVLGLG